MEKRAVTLPNPKLIGNFTLAATRVLSDVRDNLFSHFSSPYFILSLLEQL
jgi:hypothetical protein